VDGPNPTPIERLLAERASQAILQAADALTVEEIGPTSGEGVPAKIDHRRFIDSLGG
jgi:hypothetical protein